MPTIVIAPTMCGRKVPRSPSEPDTSPTLQPKRDRMNFGGWSASCRTRIAGMRSLPRRASVMGRTPGGMRSSCSISAGIAPLCHARVGEG